MPTIPTGPACPRCKRIDGTERHCKTGGPQCDWVHCPHCAEPGKRFALIDRKGYREGDFYPNGKPAYPKRRTDQ